MGIIGYTTKIVNWACLKIGDGPQFMNLMRKMTIKYDKLLDSGCTLFLDQHRWRFL